MEDHFFLFLNAKLDLYINIYEEEYIDTDQLDDAIGIVENIIDNTDDRAVIDFGNKLLEMMKIAKANLYAMDADVDFVQLSEIMLRIAEELELEKATIIPYIDLLETRIQIYKSFTA